jgi:hypothetical protein
MLSFINFIPIFPSFYSSFLLFNPPLTGNIVARGYLATDYQGKVVE